MKFTFLSTVCVVSTAVFTANVTASVDGSSLYLLGSQPAGGKFDGRVPPGPGLGAPKFGGGLGFDYTFPLSWSTLGIVVGAVYIMNPMNDADSKAALPGAKVELGNWFNVPVLGGMKYQVSNDPFDFYGVLQLGLNAAGHTSSRIATDRLESDLAFSPAVSVGLGTIIGERVDFGVRYYFLGQPKYEGRLVNTDTPVSGKQTVSLLAVTLGLHMK